MQTVNAVSHYLIDGVFFFFLEDQFELLCTYELLLGGRESSDPSAAWTYLNFEYLSKEEQIFAASSPVIRDIKNSFEVSLPLAFHLTHQNHL